MNELGLVSDLCEKSNKGEIMNCFIGQLEVSYIMFKSFLLKPTENNFPLRVKMCKEHITNSTGNLRPLLQHSLMSVDVAIVDTEGVLLDLEYFTYIYVMAFPLIFD